MTGSCSSGPALVPRVGSLGGPRRSPRALLAGSRERILPDASARRSLLQLRSHAPEQGPGEEGRPGRSWERESVGKNPWGHRGLPTRPERGNALPAPGCSQALQARRLPRGGAEGGGEVVGRKGLAGFKLSGGKTMAPS